MSNAMRFWVGDRVDRDTGGECLGAPPSPTITDSQVAIDAVALAEQRWSGLSSTAMRKLCFHKLHC